MTDDRTSAALATAVRDLLALTHRVELMAAEVGSVRESSASAHRAIAGCAEAIAKVRVPVQGVLDGTGDEAEASGPVSWWTLTDPDEARERLAVLVDWLGTVYGRYAGAELRECWIWHPAVIAELVALQDVWLDAHSADCGSATAVMDFHGRWRPETVARVAAELKMCSLEKHVPGKPESVRTSVRIPAAGSAERIADWWVQTHGATSPPIPTPDEFAEASAERAARNAAAH